MTSRQDEFKNAICTQTHMLSADIGYMFAVEFIAANETELFNIKWYLRMAKKCFSPSFTPSCSCCAIYFHFGNRTITSDDRFSCGRLCAQCGTKSPDSNLDKNCRNTDAFQFTEKWHFRCAQRQSTSTSVAHTWRRRRIDAGDEHTICHDELYVALIINFSWHMRSAASASANLVRCRRHRYISVHNFLEAIPKKRNKKNNMWKDFELKGWRQKVNWFLSYLLVQQFA